MAKHHASILLLLAVAFFSCCWSAGRHCIVPPIEALRGRDGRDGRDGAPGPQGPSGTDGMKGMTGDTGQQWRSDLCQVGSNHLPQHNWYTYSGRAAGSCYEHQGVTSDYLCLPEQPEYISSTPGTQRLSPIYGAEYEINGGPLPAITHQNLPCAVSCDSSSCILPCLMDPGIQWLPHDRTLQPAQTITIGSVYPLS